MRCLLIFLIVFTYGCKSNSKISNSKENIIFSTEMNMKQFINQLNVYVDKSSYPNLNN